MSGKFDLLRRAIKGGTGWARENLPDGSQLDAWVRDAAGRVRDAAPSLSEARDWAGRQYGATVAGLPGREDAAAWVQANIGRLVGTAGPRPAGLRPLEDALTGVVAAIQQVSDARARRVTGVVIGKLGGAAVTGGIAGLVAAFGTASTGTAIASLSGAAASTAQLYWLGSLVGLGTAAGGAMLAATGVGAAIVAAYLGRRYLLGTSRSQEDLQDHERAILVSCIALLNAVRQQLASGQEASDGDMRALAEHALIPLVRQIDLHWDSPSSQTEETPAWRPFSETLSVLYLRKLRGCTDEIGRIALAAMVARAAGA